MSHTPVNVGIVGAGAIFGAYLAIAPQLDSMHVAAVADLDMDRAKAKAEEFNIPHAYTVDDLLADPAIDIVLNLTVPKAHYSVAMAAIAAGKSIYNEKPLAITRAEGREMLDAAAAKGVLVGCAPDTFLGGSHQTCRQLIDDGRIGQPVAATAFMTCPGHESWHPSPEFYYQVGGGPMFDMGPYYLTALVNMLGPVRRVSGMTGKAREERLITSQPKCGTRVPVEVPTHVAGTLEFANGAIGTLIMSFDIWAADLPRIEVYGTEGTLSVPDPNGFGGPIKLFTPGAEAGWQEIPMAFHEYARGIGVADMACAVRTGRSHRASGALANHVLDIMHAVHDAASEGRTITLDSGVERPAPMVAGLPYGVLEW